ncbi:MAG: hypothetical protein JO040_09095 [Gemmatimonadetes bacterium]|nr:hypothetical protein [Gemmatimonadota bacterium]
MNKAFAAALLALFGASAAGAQTGHSPRVLTLPPGPRAAAMGGVLPLDGGDGSALFYNPALVDSTGGVGVEVDRYSSAATLARAFGTSSWGGGGVAVGVQALGYSVQVPFASRLPGDEGSLPRHGSFGASELAATLGYARKVGRFRLGAAASLLQQRLEADEGTGFGVDLGASSRVGPVVLGLAARNLGPALEVGGEDVDLPTLVTLNATLPSKEVGPLDVAAAGAVTRLANGTVVPGAGVEVGWWPVAGRTVVGRVGVRRVEREDDSPLTFGGGFVWDRLSVDYAYRGFDAGHVHRIGLTWR